MGANLTVSDKLNYLDLAKKIENDFFHEFSELTQMSDVYFEKYLGALVETFVLPAIELRRGVINYQVKFGSDYLFQPKEGKIIEINMEVLLGYGSYRIIAFLIAAYYRLQYGLELSDSEKQTFYAQVESAFNKLDFTLDNVPDVKFLILEGLPVLSTIENMQKGKKDVMQ